MSERTERTVRIVREKWDPQFDYITNQFIPWTPLMVDPTRAKVALVSSAGVYLKKGWHAPFDAENPYGDPSWREMPFNADPEDMAIAHTHYDHRYALQDINTVFPLQRLHELAEQGYIGSVAPSVYSFSGYITRPLSLLTDHAPNMAQRLKRMGVDIALLVPV